MNSDPYDSAAWRTFGMLDADESAIFDEALRVDPVLRGAYLEMDRLSAAVAVATTVPIEPKAGQLDRLEARLGLNTARRAQFWFGISGWAVAAVLTILLVLDRTGMTRRESAAAASAAARPTATGVPAASSAARQDGVPPAAPAIATDKTLAAESTAAKEKEAKTATKAETKRLVQEIEVLRDNLEQFQHRDRVLFEPVPGMALPIVMTMNPPGVPVEDSATLAKNEEHSPITAMLGDAMRTITNTTTVAGENEVQTTAANPPVLPSDHPMAFPIYDAARDSGTLVVSNLPATEQGEVYNLWVTTVSGGKPIYVGSLPESSASGADSFDFSLGSTMVLPSGFVLTKDPENAPANPTESNIILQGPPTPGR